MIGHVDKEGTAVHGTIDRSPPRGRQGGCRVVLAQSDEADILELVINSPETGNVVTEDMARVLERALNEVGPDIKLLRRREDIAGFARTQLEILRAAFGMLAVEGRLLYSTCSVLPAENEEVIERFLKSEPKAELAPMPSSVPLPPGAQKRVAGVQLLPGGEAGTDGFYYACLEKTAVGT